MRSLHSSKAAFSSARFFSIRRTSTESAIRWMGLSSRLTWLSGTSRGPATTSPHSVPRAVSTTT